jgi:predicted ATPase
VRTIDSPLYVQKVQLRRDTVPSFDEYPFSLAALSRIHELVGQQSQFIIATHSPIIMSYPDAEILLMDNDGIRSIVYEETEHFQVTKQFLNHHTAMLRELLAE